MSINIQDVVSEGLSILTYNGQNIATPKDNHLNIFMGIGLWSAKDGLTEGLPVDVMQMLLSAAMVRSQILQANLGASSKIIVLIADSMAVGEGADTDRVLQIVQIYKKSLEPLLDLLKIKESAQIVLSSELESCDQYQKVLVSVDNSQIIQQLKVDDEVHYDYVRTQTAIIRYMNTQEDVGVKVGWMCKPSSTQVLQDRGSAQLLQKWDELKFDRWGEEICEGSSMQYIYTKAGLKQSGNEKSVSVSEGCPYTAYPKDRRYIVQIHDKKDIKTICAIQKRVAEQWKGVAEVCSSLVKAGLVHRMLLPDDCIQTGNHKATVYKMLNHWVNPPMVALQIVDDTSACALLSDNIHATAPNRALDERALRSHCLLIDKGLGVNPEMAKESDEHLDSSFIDGHSLNSSGSKKYNLSASSH